MILGSAGGVLAAVLFAVVSSDTDSPPAPKREDVRSEPIPSTPFSPAYGLRQRAHEDAPIRLRIVDHVAGTPIKGAVALASRPGLRQCTAANSRRLATTGSDGVVLLSDSTIASLGATELLVVGAVGYRTREVPLPNEANEQIRVVALDKGMELHATCVLEDGTQLGGAVVAVSKHNVQYGSFSGANPVAGYAGLVSRLAIYSAVSDAYGDCRISGLEPGAYRVFVSHPNAFLVEGLGDDETVRLPGRQLRLVFRALEGAVLDVFPGKLRTFGKQVDYRGLVRDTGFAVFAAAAAYMRIRRQHPNAAVFVGAPRRHAAGRSGRVTFHIALRNGALVKRTVWMRSLLEPIGIRRLGALEAGASGACLVEVVGPGGQAYREVPLKFFRGHLEFAGRTGHRVDLPVGKYRYEVGGHSCFSLWHEVGPRTLTIGGGGEVVKVHRVHRAYAPVRVELRLPYEDTGLSVTLAMQDETRHRHELFNWHPGLRDAPFYLAAGRCRVEARARDLSTRPVDFVLRPGQEVRRVILRLEATAFR